MLSINEMCIHIASSSLTSLSHGRKCEVSRLSKTRTCAWFIHARLSQSGNTKILNYLLVYEIHCFLSGLGIGISLPGYWFSLNVWYSLDICMYLWRTISNCTGENFREKQFPQKLCIPALDLLFDKSFGSVSCQDISTSRALQVVMQVYCSLLWSRRSYCSDGSSQPAGIR